MSQAEGGRAGEVPGRFRMLLRPTLVSGLVLLGALLPLELVTSPAGAATPGAVQTPPADTLPADTVPVEPLTVTVLRTPISLASAPMAVSVLGEEELRRGRSGAFLEEALQGLPGVQVQNRYNPAVGERVAIRGFGARAQFGMRGIRVVVDGIPATLPDGQSTLDHLDIGTLVRVEAVRGPSSALFGNASGGVLSFHTRSPAPQPLQLDVEQVFGSHGLRRTQATASGRIGPNGYLFSVARVGWEGFRSVPDDPSDTYGASERYTLNSKFQRAAAGGELSFTLNALHLDSENPGALNEAMRDDPDRPAFGGSIAQGLGKEVRQGQLGARWQGGLAGLEADLSLFGVRRTVENPIPGVIIDLERDGGGARAQVSRNERTDWGDLRWYAGVEAEFMFDDRLNLTNNEERRRVLDQRERVRGAGLFVQADIPLPGRAKGLAGLRYDRHDFRAWDRFPREEDDPSATGRRTMDAVSPSLGVHVPVRPFMDLFASAGTVFETPSTTELANRPEGAGGFNAELEPQTGVSGEAGLRGQVGSQVSYEVTAFRMRLTNELVPFEMPDRTFFRNAGSSRHSGLEATVSASSATGLLRTDVTFSRLDARFREFEKDGEDLRGNRVPGVAPTRAHARVRLAPEGWYGELMTTWVDRVPVNDHNTARAPSYAVVDLRVGARTLPLLGDLEVDGWLAVTNLLDRHYISSVAVNAFVPPSNPAAARYYEPGPGRSLQVGFRARY